VSDGEKFVIRDGALVSIDDLREEYRIEQALKELDPSAGRGTEHDAPAGPNVGNPKLEIEVEVGDEPEGGPQGHPVRKDAAAPVRLKPSPPGQSIFDRRRF
jgi:hypothetical protein